MFTFATNDLDVTAGFTAALTAQDHKCPGVHEPGGRWFSAQYWLDRTRYRSTTAHEAR